MRPVTRTVLTLALTVVLAAPAQAAGPTATTAAPTVQTAPQPAPGSPFANPVPGDLAGQPTQTETTVTGTKRAGDNGSGRSTLLFLSFMAILMIIGVGVFIWYEGRKTRATQKRRRIRSGRTPQTAAASGGQARRGPPPPPRKRRAQAKRKKR